MKNQYDPEVHRRRSIRLKGFDYSRPGAYFVTIVVQDRLCLFGDVVDGEMQLNDVGRLIADGWEWLARNHGYVELDAYVVMPNHLHGVVVLTDEGWEGDGVGRGRGVLTDDASGRGVSDIGRGRGVSRNAPTGRKTLGRLVGAFKTVTTKQVNQLRGTPGHRMWQRDFYERVIRNDDELDLVREYIEGNPAKWEMDVENPNVVSKHGLRRTT